MRAWILALSFLIPGYGNSAQIDWDLNPEAFNQWMSSWSGKQLAWNSNGTALCNGITLVRDRTMNRGVEFPWEVEQIVNYRYDMLRGRYHSWPLSLVNLQYGQAPYKEDYLVIGGSTFTKKKGEEEKHWYYQAYNSTYSVPYKYDFQFPKKGLEEVDAFHEKMNKLSLDMLKGRALEYNGCLGFAKGVDKLNVNWDSFIFDPRAKQRISKVVDSFLDKYDEKKWGELGLPLNRGLLLYGPPGTGKSFVGKILASKVMRADYKNTVTYIYVSARHITAVNDVKRIYDFARMLTPAVIFMEDMDLIAGTDRKDRADIKNELMQQLSGLEELKGVMTIGTTNYFELIDPALTRSKRLGYHFEIGIPRHDDRVRLLKLFAGKYNITEIDFYELALLTEGMTGADLKEVVEKSVERILLGENPPPVRSPKELVLSMNTMKEAIELKKEFTIKEK